MNSADELKKIADDLERPYSPEIDEYIDIEELQELAGKLNGIDKRYLDAIILILIEDGCASLPLEEFKRRFGIRAESLLQKARDIESV